MTNDEAAKALGCKASEVAGTESHDAGTVVTTTAGARLIILDGGEVQLFGRPDGRPVGDPDAPPYNMAVYDAGAESASGEVESDDDPEVERVDEPTEVGDDDPEVEHVTEPKSTPARRGGK